MQGRSVVTFGHFVPHPILCQDPKDTIMNTILCCEPILDQLDEMRTAGANIICHCFGHSHFNIDTVA